MWIIVYKTDNPNRYIIKKFSRYEKSFEYEQMLKENGIKVIHQKEFLYDGEGDEYVLLNEIIR